MGFSLFGSNSSSEDTQQCKHCGRMFEVKTSVGWQMSREQFTCNDCYRNGKRDWATDYHDENTF